MNLERIISEESNKFKKPIQSDGLHLLIINCCKEACRQILELVSENVSINYKEVEQGENQWIWLQDYPEVNKQSILDTINQIG